MYLNGRKYYNLTIETAKRLLGKAVRAGRERAGITQQALADAIGRSLGAVGGLERGDVWPEYETLTAIAAALGVSELSLFTWAPAPSPTPQEALAVIARELETRRETPARDQLAERVARLGPDARRALEAMLPGMESVTTGDDSPKQHRKPPEKGK